MKQLLIFIIFYSMAWAGHKYTNALIHESSPYLQQHAHNPVNWYPWGKEALQKAKKEHKLIFLSIGYSTCHWCHVMEEESFTDTDIAKMLNNDFISIKVDREAYPQLDKKYQQLYMQVHGKRGGWPLSVFLSPNQEVFHLATYIPKDEGYGSKGLVALLSSFVKLQKDRPAFEKTIAKYQKRDTKKRLKMAPSTKLIDKTLKAIVKQYDPVNGGFATRPKFPEASKLELLLDMYALSGKEEAFKMAEQTLTKMAQGGIYDQIGGGFFRYTTDYAWQIPHFEKMLYTNAELIAVYAKMYQYSPKTLYKKVIDESIAQMEKHFMKKGVYLSASDADSDGEEGGYFIYDYTEVKSALNHKGWKPEEIEEALAYLGIEEDGNIDGDFSQPHITSNKAPAKLEAFKAYLRSISEKRTFPFVDKKVNTTWNAMMVKALFEASKIDPKYLTLAQKRLAALWRLMRKDGVLYHQTLLGEKPKQQALLEDYAFLMDALIAAYERTYDGSYLNQLETLAREAVAKFYKEKQWYLSDDDIKAKADFDDRYYTSALSVMLDSLLRMASLVEEPKYRKIVKESIIDQAGNFKEPWTGSAKLVQTMLRLEMGDVIIHASKEKLRLAQKKIDAMQYPFILSAVQESDEYLTCKITMCFANDKNITKLIEKINKAIK